jgi:RimJ/RimL family protein N-acetyltransferase
MVQRTWFPEALEGTRVILRRHSPENVSAFLRWYADPEIARLARYQATPMRVEEIQRFFAARVVGPDALAMAVHEKATDRLVGTCAFSQLDGENGSALYHITIGEPDAWGHGFGTEATQLMLDHAFGTLGLHRIALYVFEFNERAIRAYRRCGFVVEGRSRESVWRDGRWWDEMAMSVLESDWRARRELNEDGPGTGAGAGAGAGAIARATAGSGGPSEAVAPAGPLARAIEDGPTDEAPIAAGTSDRVRRTLGRWR